MQFRLRTLLIVLALFLRTWRFSLLGVKLYHYRDGSV